MMSKEAMKLALNKAFQLGQRYWSWADSEYSSHWKKADAAKAEFDQLVQDTINAALAEQPAQRYPLCNYQHGHAIGCKNNPVDIALNKMAENARELGLDYEPARDSGIVTAGGADPRTQRTWIGLTDEERKLVRNSVGYNQFVTAGEYAEHVQKATETKLEEKNT